jgi:hypothetical protein
MRPTDHRSLRRFAVAPIAATIAAALALAAGAQTAVAADYQDSRHNVCEGTFTTPGCKEWGKHVTGEDSVAVGDAMMNSLKGGSFNVALDFNALAKNTEGKENLALGTAALESNTTGSGNIALGTDALISNTIGSNNLASGPAALFANTTGNNNVASGTEALEGNTAGHDNLASGFKALRANTTGIDNLALGTEVLELQQLGGRGGGRQPRGQAHRERRQRRGQAVAGDVPLLAGGLRRRRGEGRAPRRRAPAPAVSSPRRTPPACASAGEGRPWCAFARRATRSRRAPRRSRAG